MSLACGEAITLSVQERFWLSFGTQFKVCLPFLCLALTVLANALSPVYSAANYMYNMLRAIFGHNFTDIPNHLPESAGITTALMMCFLLAWLIHLPFCYFRPYQLRKFFWFKTIVSVPAIFGLFIWAMANTRGRLGGGLYSSSSSSSSAVAWMILSAINSGMG